MVPKKAVSFQPDVLRRGMHGEEEVKGPRKFDDDMSS